MGYACVCMGGGGGASYGSRKGGYNVCHIELESVVIKDNGVEDLTT